MPPPKVVLLYDQTGGANASFNTGAIDAGGFDSLLIEVFAVGGISSASNLYFIEPAINPGRLRSLSLGVMGNGNANVAGWGPGSENGANGDYCGGLPAPVPPSVAFETNPLGVGISARIRVFGRFHT